MRREIHSNTSIKIIAALDVAATLAVEHIGVTYNLSVFHPAILGTVAGATYVLLKHGDVISHHLVNMPEYVEEAFKRYPLSGGPR